MKISLAILLFLLLPPNVGAQTPKKGFHHTPAQALQIALMSASEKGALYAVEYLLKVGAKPDRGYPEFEKIGSFFGPIHVATIADHPDVVRVLLKAGANPNLRFADRKDPRGSTPLMIAANMNHVECARVLLKFHADQMAKNARGETAADIARRRHNDGILNLLNKERL